MNQTKHILITGASSGIGQQLAILLAKQNAKLSLCGRDSTKLAATIGELATTPVYSDCFCISEELKINHFVEQAEQAFGPVDVLINCAGLNNVRQLSYQTEISRLDWLMKVNCYAPISFINAVVPKQIEQQEGVIINVLSTTCLFSNPGISSYTASKAALDSYTKVMRKELRDKNIKVLSVYPGGVDSDFREQTRPEYLTPIAVAKAIANLLNTDINTHIHELVVRPSSEINY